MTTKLVGAIDGINLDGLENMLPFSLMIEAIVENAEEMPSTTVNPFQIKLAQSQN